MLLSHLTSVKCEFIFNYASKSKTINCEHKRMENRVLEKKTDTFAWEKFNLEHEHMLSFKGSLRIML